MVHHTFQGSDLLKLPPECNKWCAYIWSLIGIQLTWLVVTRKCWCFATQNGLLQLLCVMEQVSCFCRRMWIFACLLLKPVYAYGVMISDIDSRLWKYLLCCVVVIVCIM